MTQLVKYEAAKHALAEAKSVDEVKKIHDVGAAMKAYAQQAQDKQLEIDACEIRIRAERRLGEMIRHQKETVGLATGGQPYQHKPTGTHAEPVDRPTLADVGISKKLSSRSQAIANIPECDFEATLAEHREQQQAVTAKTMDTLARQGKKPHVSNNSGNNDWYTPEVFTQAARSVMGCIDVDPASSETANKYVKASEIYTAETNGLEREWHGRIWMNPPYAQPLVSQFCQKLSDEYESGRVTEFCALVNNATETQWFNTLCEHANTICFPKGRVKFWGPEGNTGAPLQGQAIVYAGPNAEAFHNVFQEVGIVVGLL